MTTKKLTVNGITLNVCDSGNENGKPVLFLHGFPDSLQVWSDVTPPLVHAGFRVIAYDQRGYGDSDAPSDVSAYKLDSILADVQGVLDALKIKEPIALVGHDWGAAVAWLFAITHPQKVKELVAISVGHPQAYRNAGFAQKRKAWYIGFFLIPGLAESLFSMNDWKIFRKFASKNAGNEKQKERWLSELTRPGRLTAGLNWYRANITRLMFSKPGRCQVPTMGIWGPDVALTEEQMVNSKSYVDAPWRYERFSGCKHWIPVEKPTELAALLIEYLRSIGEVQ